MKRRDLSAQSRADLHRLWRLFRPYLGWMFGGALLALAALLANVGLLAVSGHFIASMALAGIAGIAFNYFTPAALIRAFALTRTGGRYLERLITHEATFRLLAQLRVWFYERLEPLAPARLQDLRATDLLSRIQADIDTLNQLYLRLFVPVVVAALASVVIVAVMAVFSVPTALGTALLLAAAGVWLPRWLQRRGAAAGARTVLNLAPAAPVDPELFAALDILVANEGEAASLGGDPEGVARQLRTALVVTHGGAGATAYLAAGGRLTIPALPVAPLDTTGAGDTFVGVLTAGLDQGLDLDYALRRASAAAGLACLARGAQSAMPGAAAIEEAVRGL